ncbi:MAG: hypothetical protein Q8J70_05715 [Thiobacillus sp.]|nr:hypothetical protein [Thiobacillus sp.]
MLRLLLTLWALPVTLLGLFVVLMARSSGGAVRRVDGVLEAAGGWPARILQRGLPFSGPVAAVTLGHVVVGLSQAALDATRIHERVHVRQFERWGVLLLVLYPLAGLHAWLRGGCPYRDNVFEQEARLAESTTVGAVKNPPAHDQSMGR